jgi:hypothetical protein
VALLFDLFRVEVDGSLRWIEAVPSVEAAENRVRGLIGNHPGHYILFDHRTETRIPIDVGVQGGYSESKSEYSRHIPVRSCWVTIQDTERVSHRVEVTAASLYETVSTRVGGVPGNDWVTDVGARFDGEGVRRRSARRT